MFKFSINKRVFIFSAVAITAVFCSFAFTQNVLASVGGACPYPVKSLSEAGLTSVTVTEATGGNNPYVFTAYQILNNGAIFQTEASESYTAFVSDVFGNPNSNGSYITVNCVRNGNYTNGQVGNNIESISTNLGYADRVTTVRVGTGLSGDYATSNGYVANALGAPDNNITYLGDGRSSFTVGFCEALKKTVPPATIICSVNNDCGVSGYTGSPFCQNNNIYQNYKTWTCNNAGNSNSYCSSDVNQQLVTNCTGNQTCSNGSCHNNNYNTCASHSYQRCNGNYLYWYDSCGSQQDYQYCANGCYNNSCQNNNNYNYYGNCTYHAYKDCQGNAIYWFGSCGTLQDLYQVCSSGQICKYGQCVYQAMPVVPVAPVVYRKVVVTKPAVTNSEPKQKACGNGLCETTLNETNTNCPADCKINNAEGVTVSFFAKQNKDATQWQKEIQINSNGQAYFMISAKNNSSTQINDVNVSANIPGEIYSLGNLQVDGVPVSGDIVVGINVGSLAGGATKSITFEGKTQDISIQAIKQAAAVTNVEGTIKTDSVSIGLNPSVALASVSSSQATNSGFWAFLKRWYGWIVVALVLIFLFIIVFKRFSSES